MLRFLLALLLAQSSHAMTCGQAKTSYQVSSCCGAPSTTQVKEQEDGCGDVYVIEHFESDTMTTAAAIARAFSPGVTNEFGFTNTADYAGVYKTWELYYSTTRNNATNKFTTVCTRVLSSYQALEMHYYGTQQMFWNSTENTSPLAGLRAMLGLEKTAVEWHVPAGAALIEANRVASLPFKPVSYGVNGLKNFKEALNMDSSTFQIFVKSPAGHGYDVGCAGTGMASKLTGLFMGGRNFLDHVYSSEILVQKGSTLYLLPSYGIGKDGYNGVVQFEGGSITSHSPQTWKVGFNGANVPFATTITPDFYANYSTLTAAPLDEFAVSHAPKWIAHATLPGPAATYQDAIFGALLSTVDASSLGTRKVFSGPCAPDGSFITGYQTYDPNGPAPTVSDFTPDFYKTLTSPPYNGCYIKYEVRETIFLLDQTELKEPIDKAPADCYVEMRNVELVPAGDGSCPAASTQLQQVISATAGTIRWIQFNTGTLHKATFTFPDLLP